MTKWLRAGFSLRNACSKIKKNAGITTPMQTGHSMKRRPLMACSVVIRNKDVGQPAQKWQCQPAAASVGRGLCNCYPQSDKSTDRSSYRKKSNNFLSTAGDVLMCTRYSSSFAPWQVDSSYCQAPPRSRHLSICTCL